MRAAALGLLLATAATCTGCKRDRDDRGAPAAPPGSLSPSRSLSTSPAVATHVALPKAAGRPPRPTTRPLDRAQLDRLAAIEHADFVREARGATATSIEVRHTTRARPTLGVTIEIAACANDCPALTVAAWQPRRAELAAALPPALRDRPDTRLELTAQPIAGLGGATAIATYQLAAAAGPADHGQPTSSYLDAYTLDYHDGVNRIRVTASYLDDALGGVDRLLAIAPPEDLQQLAAAFLSFYVQAWP